MVIVCCNILPPNHLYTIFFYPAKKCSKQNKWYLEGFGFIENTYSGDLDTEHLKTRDIWIQNFLKFGFQMVWYSNQYSGTQMIDGFGFQSTHPNME